MADNRAIGIFDSGLGGLTVTKEIISKLPNENIVYFGDTGRVPYGNRSRDTIIKYAAQDEAFLLKQDVKLIVAACGTVSSVAVDSSKQLPVPFFEVISHAAKAAVRATKNKKIGVIGTNATINSGEHKRIILEEMPEAKVFCQGCSLFVPLVEEGWFIEDDEVVLKTVERYLAPMKDVGVDTLILGCTHYPVLSKAIEKVMGKGVVQINAGVAVADAVADFLAKNDMTNDTDANGEHKFYVSDKPMSFSKTASILLGEDICGDKIKQVDIEK